MDGVFIWKPWNEDHIAEHGVSPEEAMQVVRHAKPPYPEAVGEEKHRVRGRTEAGRWLHVIFIYIQPEDIDLRDIPLQDRDAIVAGEDMIFVIHARDLTNNELRAVQRRKR